MPPGGAEIVQRTFSETTAASNIPAAIRNQKRPPGKSPYGHTAGCPVNGALQINPPRAQRITPAARPDTPRHRAGHFRARLERSPAPSLRFPPLLPLTSSPVLYIYITTWKDEESYRGSMRGEINIKGTLTVINPQKPARYPSSPLCGQLSAPTDRVIPQSG